MSNIYKLKHGIPLSDLDRKPWLHAIVHQIQQSLRKFTEACGIVLVSCSALKQQYRLFIAQDIKAQMFMRDIDVTFVYLNVPKDELQYRLLQRTHQFMPSSLLDSQLQTLEVPTLMEGGALYRVLEIECYDSTKTKESYVDYLWSTL
jgi:carbohydrate kinase (thermoresistant glucokinase family)